MASSSRRFVAGLIRLVLVALAFVFVAGYFKRRVHRNEPIHVQREAPATETLAPGDLRIYSADSTVDLVLSGDHILAGLSPKTVAKVKMKLDSSAARDTGGLGGSIGKLVKQSVAGAIGTHASYPLSEIRDIRLDGDQIVVDWKSGKRGELFGDAKINNEKFSSSFRHDDAERFVEAVRARIGLPAAR
jgi:hypothetical protein